VFTFLFLVSSVFAGAREALPTLRCVDPGIPAAPAPVTGRVIDAHGQPLENARVTLYQTALGGMASLPKVTTVQEVVTGADGRYCLTPAQDAGCDLTRFVIVRKEGLAWGWVTWLLPASPGSDIVLGPPTELAGDVVDENGRPLAGADVHIAVAVMGEVKNRRILAAPGLLSARTDEHGHFVFPNLPGDATVEFLVRRPGQVAFSTLAQAVFCDSSPASFTRLLCGEACGRFAPGQAGIKLVLPRAASIRGVVIETTSGKPVRGVRVASRTDRVKDGFLPPDPVTTADDGVFHLDGLAPGRHMVHLATTRGQVAEWAGDPVPVDLQPEEMKTGVRLEVAKGGILEALVKEAGGKPVAKAIVRMSHAQRDTSFHGTTDENGLARVRVPTGPYRVFLPIQPGYALQCREERVTIGEDETQRIEFVLRVKPMVSGTVRDEAGHPLAGAAIQVTSLVDGKVTTDADGKFTVSWDPGFARPADGTCVLIARDLVRNLVEMVDVNDQTKNLDLTLKTGAVLAGTVLDAQGQPLPGARLSVMLRSSDPGIPLGFFIAETATGAEGTFELKALPPGRPYYLSAMATGYGLQTLSIEASHVNDHRRDVGPLRLSPANLSISGRVVDSQGQPVAGATVCTDDGDDIQADAEGRFVLNGVAAGPVLLLASTRRPSFMLGSLVADGGATGVVIVVSSK